MASYNLRSLFYATFVFLFVCNVRRKKTVIIMEFLTAFIDQIMLINDQIAPILKDTLCPARVPYTRCSFQWL